MQLSYVFSNILFGAVLVQATNGGWGGGGSGDECSDKGEYKRTGDWAKECKCSDDDDKHHGWKRAGEIMPLVAPAAADVATSEDWWHKPDKDNCSPKSTCPPCPSSTSTEIASYGAAPLPTAASTDQPPSPPEVTTTTTCSTSIEVSTPYWPTMSTTMDTSPPPASTYAPPSSQSTYVPPPSQSTYVPPAYPTGGIVVPTTLATSRAPTPTGRVSASGRPTTTSSPYVVVNGANAPAAGGMLLAAAMAVGAML